MGDTTNLKVLRYGDLREIGVIKNRMTLSRWVKAGRFPRPLRLGKNSVAWRFSDVEQWLNACAEKAPRKAS
jgi:prophage regulatory protein